MIISRTPFRISFFGGGTDYPLWYEENGGAVLSTAIDKYCYIYCRSLPPFFEHRLRIVYSKIESCRTFEEIQIAVLVLFAFSESKEGWKFTMMEICLPEAVWFSFLFYCGTIACPVCFEGDDAQ